MPASVAGQRYLQRYLETGLPPCPYSKPHWQHSLVIPAYRESPDLLPRLAQLSARRGRCLVILVLNRPDSDPDPGANTDLRDALKTLPPHGGEREDCNTCSLNEHTDLYVLDLEALGGPTPAALGVGLARKSGCDLVLQWMAGGAISGTWIGNTDADATLPKDYFEQLDEVPAKAVAAVFPFRHEPGADQRYDDATALYELRLHHYVLGLKYAGSPYAHHTLGSCLAVRARAYAQVRGFPKRAGAEDFYLLNKLAKVGPIAQLQGEPVRLQSRQSDRVPFGTGPAVATIAAAEQPMDSPLFYHPACFEALRVLLASLPALQHTSVEELPKLLTQQGLEQNLAQQSHLALEAMDIATALAHCRRQGKSSEQFQRQFHQWFDAFRSLKFIHTLRDTGWPRQSLRALEQLQPALWPGDDGSPRGVAELREANRRYWNAGGRGGASPTN